MARTNTKTETYTFSRLNLIKIQVDEALIRFGKSSVMEFYRKLIDKHWLGQLSFYALDNNNYCRGRLTLYFDWDKHNQQVSVKGTEIQIDDDWKNNVAPNLNYTLELFEEFIDTYSLQVITRFWYADGVNKDKADSELGVSDGEPIRWFEGDSQEIPRSSLMKLYEVHRDLKMIKPRGE